MSKVKDPKKEKYFENQINMREGYVKEDGTRGRAYEFPKRSQDIVDRSKGIQLKDNVTKIVITKDANAKNAQSILGWCKQSIEKNNVEIVSEGVKDGD